MSEFLIAKALKISYSVSLLPSSDKIEETILCVQLKETTWSLHFRWHGRGKAICLTVFKIENKKTSAVAQHKSHQAASVKGL